MEPTAETEPIPKRPRRRVLLGLRRIVVGLVVVAVTVVATALAALRFRATRAMLRSPIAELISGAIPGSIEIGAIDVLSFDAIVLRDVRVLDPEGRTVARAQRLQARPELALLFDERVRLEDVRARGVTVELRPTPTGSLSIVDTFVEPTPPNEPPDESTSSWEVDVRGIAIDDGLVRLAIGPEPFVELREVSIRGRVHVTDSTLVRVDHLTARGFRGDAVLLATDDLLGALRTGPNASSHARATIAGGDDRLRLDARVGNGTRDDSFAEGSIEASLDIDALTTRLLEPFDLGDLAAEAPSELHGSVRVSGTFASARIRGELFVDGRRVVLDGGLAMAETSRLEVCLDDTPLVTFWRSLPATRLGGCFVVEVGSTEASDLPVSLAVRRARVDGTALPDATLSAIVHFDTRRIDVHDFVLVGYAEVSPPPITIEGWADFDGQVELQVVLRSFRLEGDPAIRQLIGGARGTRGALDGRVDFTLRNGATNAAPDTVRASVHLSIDGLRASGVRARRIEVSSEASGTLERPSFDGVLVATSIESSGVRFERFEASARGTTAGARLSVDGSMSRNREVHLVATTQAAGAVQRASLEGTVGRPGSPWQVTLDRGTYDTRSGAIGVERFSLARRDARFALDGTLNGRGAVAATLTIRALNPKDVFEALAMTDPGVSGTLTLDATLGGTANVPTAHVEGSFADGEILGSGDLSATFLADLLDSGLHVALDVDADDRGSLELDGDARWPKRTPIDRALEVADLDVRAKAAAIDLASFDRALPAPLGIGGTMNAELVVSGRTSEPRANATITVDDASHVSLPLSRALDLELEASLGPDGVEASLAMRDGDDELLHVDARAAVASRSFATAFPDPAAIAWSIHARTPERSIASLPLAAETTSGIPLVASFDLVAEHRVGRPISARWSGRLRGETTPTEDGDEDAANGDRPCGSVGALAISVEGILDRGRASLDLGVSVAERSASTIHFEASVPIDAWASGDSEAMPSGLDVAASIDDLDLAAIPSVCEYASGPIRGSVAGSSLESGNARLAIELRSSAIRFADEAAVAIDLDGELTRSNAIANIAITAPDGSRSTVHATLPIDMRSGVGGGPMSVEARFDELSLEPFTAFTPFVPGRAGTIDGWLTIGGTTRDPTPNGELRLRDSTLVMPGLDQRLSDTDVHVSLSPQKVVIHEFRARDVRGRVAIDGEISFAGRTPTAMHFDVRSSSFPVRQSGIAIASVDSVARLDLVRETSALRGTVAFDSLLVRMPDESPGSVQALEENPDVVYLDTPPAGWEPNLSDVPAASAVETTEPDASTESAAVASSVEDDSPFVPTYVRLDLRRAFWIRRTDFAVMLSADLRLAVEEHGVALTGRVEALRGHLDLLGRSFDIREGTIRFSGGETINPTFDITAVANSGEENQVRVHVAGTLDELKLEFFDDADRELTAGLAVQCITTGDCTEFGEIGSDGDSSTATEQARSALASMTVGLLTTAARHGIGDAVPRIAVSTGDRLEEVTVRAGFDANRLIPPFLRSLVSNLYVEGFVSNESQRSSSTETSSSDARTSGGFLLELRHPHRVVTRAQYEPPATWSLDVTWHP